MVAVVELQVYCERLWENERCHTICNTARYREQQFYPSEYHLDIILLADVRVSHA